MAVDVRDLQAYLRIIPDPLRVSSADWRESHRAKRLNAVQNKVFDDVA
jgi:hypothetical protein